MTLPTIITSVQSPYFLNMNTTITIQHQQSVSSVVFCFSFFCVRVHANLGFCVVHTLFE